MSAAGAAAAAMFGKSFAREVAATPQLQLSPEVARTIQGTFFEHASALPDPSERASTLKLVLAGAEYAYKGELSAAESSMRAAVADDPSSRSAHAGLGQVLLELHRIYGKGGALAEGIGELITADTLSLGRREPAFCYTIGKAAATLGNRAVLDDYFAAVVSHSATYDTLLGYGVGLRGLDDAKADTILRDAHARRQVGQIDAASELATHLFQQGRFRDALGVVSPPSLSADELIPHVHMVRGAILEKMGDLNTARSEYEHYLPMVPYWPLPADLAIPGSELQLALRPIAGASHVTEAEMLAKFGRLLYTEAIGEGVGGMRAVGWVVRTRVVHGACSGCISPIDNSGSPRWHKYWQVMTQSGPQFNIGGTSNSTSNNTALTVYAGSVPDPHKDACVAGIKSGSGCTGTCSQQTYDGAFSDSARVFFSTSGSCSGSPQFGCAPAVGLTCGGAAPNNCFSRCP